jgi:hypothetical protein
MENGPPYKSSLPDSGGKTRQLENRDSIYPSELRDLGPDVVHWERTIDSYGDLLRGGGLAYQVSSR